MVAKLTYADKSISVLPDSEENFSYFSEYTRIRSNFNTLIDLCKRKLIEKKKIIIIITKHPRVFYFYENLYKFKNY